MIPVAVLIDHLFPFLDRSTYEACLVLNQEVYRECRRIRGPALPWPTTELEVGRMSICSIAFSRPVVTETMTCQYSEWVACGTDNGDICIWHSRNGQKHSLVGGHPSAVATLAFSQINPRDGSVRLASGGTDGRVRVWHLPALPKHSTSVDSYNDDDDGNDNKTSLPWALQVSSEVYTGHSRQVHSLVFVPNSSLLLSSAQDTNVCIWDVDQRRRIGSIPSSAVKTTRQRRNDRSTLPMDGYTNELLESIALSEKGRWLATATWFGKIQIWELAQDAYRPVPLQLECGEPLTRLQFHESSSKENKEEEEEEETLESLTLYGLRGNRIRVWDFSETNEEKRVSFRSCEEQTIPKPLLSQALSSDGSRAIFFGGRRGDVAVCRIGTTMEESHVECAFSSGDYDRCSAVFSPDRTAFATGGDGGVLRIWSLSDTC